MTTLVCTGDSFTEGMCDQLRPDRRYLGWADRVAQIIADHPQIGRLAASDPGVRYANLAVRGRLLDQVRATQVPMALQFKPDILTFHAGPNDVLRPGTDLADLNRRYAETVALLCAEVPRVLVFTAVPRTGTGRTADWLAGRFEPFNDHVREVAARTGVTLVDMARIPALRDRRLWADDRLHLNALGHQRVAAAVAAALGITVAPPAGHDGATPAVPDATAGADRAPWWEVPLPPTPPPGAIERYGADARWLAAHLTPWLGRRIRRVSSGDNLSAKDPVPRLVAPTPQGAPPAAER